MFDQKIPDRLRLFLGEVETAVGSGIQSRFAVEGLSTCDTIWACGFPLTSSRGKISSRELIY